MTDDELIKQIQLGDKQAADELIERYYTPILRYCNRLVLQKEKAEDLTQETFLKLFKSISAYHANGKFRPYIYTIAHRLCIDESRKAVDYSLEEVDEISCETIEIRNLEDKSEVDALLGRLSLEQREAIVLRYGEELSFFEISKVLGCNMRTVQSRVRAALKILREERERNAR